MALVFFLHFSHLATAWVMLSSAVFLLSSMSVVVCAPYHHGNLVHPLCVCLQTLSFTAACSLGEGWTNDTPFSPPPPPPLRILFLDLIIGAQTWGRRLAGVALTFTLYLPVVLMEIPVAVLVHAAHSCMLGISCKCGSNLSTCSPILQPVH